MANKLELTWYGKEEQVNVEPRLLIENPTLSNCNNEPNTENMLIHGDNLLALKALEKEYTGRIKCIYIDPPYNINAANEHYDDKVENSKWLSLMSARLKILKNLLDDDGVIFVQIDKEQSAYLKILMDDIFDRSNYITTIAVRMSATSGFKIEHSDKTIVKNVEYLHVYSKSLQLEPVYEAAKYDTHYSKIITKIENEKYNISNLIDEERVIELFEKYSIDNKIKNLPLLYDVSEEFKQYVFDNREIIGRIHTAPASVKSDSELNGLLNNTEEVVKRNYSGEDYYIKKKNSGYDQFIPISLKYNMVDSVEGYSLQLSNILGDWWDGFYLDMGNVENEGGIDFKNSKKPERLLFRIINNFTKPGDLVLDSFLGSATTAAVAHKLGRKYIGVELGEHAYSMCKPRLDSVIAGDDTGISSFVDWKGGGAYKFYELAPTLIKKDEFDEYVINQEYDADMLAAAVALNEGFSYEPDKDVFWKQARGSENSYMYTTTRHITAEYLDSIESMMGDNEFLIIVCKSFDANLKNNYKNIALKKIPQLLLEKCEFGKDNYDLNIINPPIVETDDEEEMNE